MSDTSPAPSIAIESMVSQTPASSPGERAVATSEPANPTTTTPQAPEPGPDTVTFDGTDSSIDAIAAYLQGTARPLAPADPATGADEEADPAEDDPAAAEVEDTEEAEAKTGDDPEAEADPEDPTENALPPALQKRLDSLTAIKEKFKTQRDDLRAKVDELEAKLAETAGLAPVVLPVTPANPLADLTTEAAIRQRIRDAEAVMKWADANPDGATMQDDKGEEVYFSPEEIQRRRLEAERVKEIHGPKRLNYVTANQQAAAVAKEIYPELFQPGSFLATEADKFVADNPGITANPNYPLFAADWVIGAAARHGILKVVPVKAAGDATARPSASATSSASPSAVAPAPKPSPAPTAAAGAVPARKPKAAGQGALMDSFAASGGADMTDLANLLLQRAG